MDLDVLLLLLSEGKNWGKRSLSCFLFLSSQVSGSHDLSALP